MKIVSRIFGVIIILVCFVFFVKNMDLVNLHFIGYEASIPLALVLFGVLIVGFIMGVLAMTPTFLRQRHEISKHKKALAKKDDVAKQPAPVPPLQPDRIIG